jgi:hypothetical protein
MPAVNRDKKNNAFAFNQVASYQEGCRLLSQVHGILEQKERQSTGCVRPVHSRELKHIIAEYERETWKRILAEMFRRARLSLDRFRDLLAEIEAGRIPELSFENLQRVVLESSVGPAR